jgi:hypothetical protein
MVNDEGELWVGAAKATKRSENAVFLLEIQRMIQLALHLTQGTVLAASNRYWRWAGSLIYLSMGSMFRSTWDT